MLRTALDLIGKGFLVFPCRPGDKQPLVEGGFRSASREKLTVEQWWRQWPDAQVGVWPARCDPPLLVLDFDCKNGAPGLEHEADLEIEGLLPPTMEAATPSGGRHRFYRLPAGAPPIGNRALAPGVDIRSENGYVVWYGANGHALAEAPPELLARCTAARERQESADAWLVEPDLPANVEHARRFLQAAEPAIEGQGGDHWTYATAEILRDYGVSEETALALMLEEWNDRCVPPWSPDELEIKIANAYQYAQRPAGNRCVEMQQTINALKAAVPKPTWTSAPASGFRAKGVDFMWHPYILAGHITIIGGRGGCGKGLVAAHVAAVVSTGGHWPCGAQAERGRVLWCETEDPIEQALIPRLQAAGADLEQVHFANPRLGFDDFARLVAEFKPALLVMSPLVSFLRGLADIRDEMGVRTALEALQALLEAGNTAALGIGHLNKKPDLSGVERLLGSVAFANFVRSVVLAAPEPDTDDTVRLAHAKHNLSTKGADWLYRPRHVGADRRSQHIKLEWTRPESNVNTDTLFDKRKADPGSDTALGWLITYLQDAGEVDFKVLIKDAQEAGHTKASVQKAKNRTQRVQVRHTGNFPPTSLWRLTP